jgi:Holliday junction resolvasome RuvABC endonuclease subunit
VGRMERVAGVDPGPVTSGFAVIEYDEENLRVLYADKEVENEILRISLVNACYMSLTHGNLFASSSITVAIEKVVSYGKSVGQTTFDTAFWSGMFCCAAKTAGMGVKLVSRPEVKTILYGATTYRDEATGSRKGVSNAILKTCIESRFEPTGGGKNPFVGTKAQPGPLYGVPSHAMSALAVAIASMSV